MKKRGRDNFNRFKPIINFLVFLNKIVPKIINNILLNLFSQIRGLLGLLVRYILLKNLLKNCGNNVSVHSGVYIFSPRNISIGDNVSIHPMSYIDGSGGIEIGNDVSIAHNVTILSTDHNFSSRDIPIKDQGVKYEKVKICDNVWIGAKASILSGVTINSGCVVAAGSLVTKTFPENTIIAGVPASIIKRR